MEVVMTRTRFRREFAVEQLLWSAAATAAAFRQATSVAAHRMNDNSRAVPQLRCYVGKRWLSPTALQRVRCILACSRVIRRRRTAVLLNAVIAEGSPAHVRCSPHIQKPAARPFATAIARRKQILRPRHHRLRHSRCASG